MTLYQKIRWCASILLVFFIVLMTNIIDKDNFKKLKNSVTTIYEDRIVANDLLFEISVLIHQKEVAYIKSDTIFFSTENLQINHKLDGFIERYELTKLTPRETTLFNDLKKELLEIKREETSFSIFDGSNSYSHRITKISNHLFELTKVQLYEGKEQLQISSKAINTINLLSQGEIIFLIIMAILIQIVILYKPKRN